MTTFLRRAFAALAAIATAACAAPVALAGTPAMSLDPGTARAHITVGYKDDGKEYRWREVLDQYPGRTKEMWAWSPSMQRDVPLFVITPNDNSEPRPIVYLLNGGDGGEGKANWVMQTDVVDFYLNKNVNVVIPMSGKFSYYTDWEQDIPFLGGRQKWETFLTRELPAPLERTLHASSQRALLGMSMSATSAMLLAEHNPGFFDMVGGFSGCYATAFGAPLEYVRLTVNRGNAQPEQMWGALGGPNFIWHDALAQAERLRGTKLYVSNGSGFAGIHDLWSTPYTHGDSVAVFIHVVNGGIIEGATNQCTHQFKAKLDRLGIPATWNLRTVGTHSWGWWKEDLRHSWRVIADAFGQDPNLPDHP